MPTPLLTPDNIPPHPRSVQATTTKSISGSGSDNKRNSTLHADLLGEQVLFPVNTPENYEVSSVIPSEVDKHLQGTPAAQTEDLQAKKNVPVWH